MFQVSQYFCNNQKVEEYKYNSSCYLMFSTLFPQPYLINSIFVTFYVGTLVTRPIWKVNILDEIQWMEYIFFSAWNLNLPYPILKSWSVLK